MKRLFPESIAGRTLLVLLVGLTVSHVLGVAFYFTDRTNALLLAGGEHIAERIVTVTRFVENASPAERPRVATLADNATLRVMMSATNAVNGQQADWHEKVLRRSFRSHFRKLGDRNFLLRYTDVGAPDFPPALARKIAGVPRRGKTILVSLQLADSNWLNFVAPVDPTESFWSRRFILSMTVTITAVVILSAMVVYYLNTPLKLFAQAARRLGIDVQAPPLPETGPREVRQVIHAFNEMQERLRRLIENRTLMLAAISHDLRTPITVLRLRAEFIEDGEERGKTLATLEEMESMIASILAFARDDAEAEARTVVDLGALTGSICHDMADTGHDIDFPQPATIPYECRASAIRRALTNLIENAVKYGGKARVSLMDTGDGVHLVIEDEGPGISEAELEKVFSPFYRVEKSRSREKGGVGLGLSVARTIIDAHGGDITLRNGKEGGLRVDVTLPR